MTSLPAEPADICLRIREAHALLLITHARSDGDALGSLAALAQAATDAGKTAQLLVPDPIPERYRFLFPDRTVHGAPDFQRLADAADLIVIVDTCAAGQLDGLVEALRERRGKIVVVDHHRSADDLADLQWIDPHAAAAGVMVHRLLNELLWPLTLPIAEAIMIAVTTDTGWLRFANTDPEALRVTAECVSAGVRPDKLYRTLFQTDRPQRLKLIARVLDTLELHCDDRLAVMTIRRDDFSATGAAPDETENLVNESLRIATVETAIILIENDPCIRVSLRSRDAVDVAAIAREYGGGGHARAAGLRVETDLDTLKAELIARCTEALHDAGRTGS